MKLDELKNKWAKTNIDKYASGFSDGYHKAIDDSKQKVKEALDESGDHYYEKCCGCDFCNLYEKLGLED